MWTASYVFYGLYYNLSKNSSKKTPKNYNNSSKTFGTFVKIYVEISKLTSGWFLNYDRNANNSFWEINLLGDSKISTVEILYQSH